MPSHSGPRVRVLLMDAKIQSCLPVLKALRLAGHHVTIGGSDPLGCGFFSRYPQRRLTYRDPNKDPEGCLSDLIKYLSTGEFDILIPILDISAELVAKNKSELERFVRIPLVDYPIFMRARDKSQTMKIARAHGIPTPKTYFPGEQGIDEISRIVDYPVLIKPNFSAGARGITKVENARDLKKLYPLVEEYYGPSTIQEFIPQTDFQYKVQIFIDNQSTVRACITCIKLRYYPVNGGSGTLFCTIKRDDIAEIGKNLLSCMDWRGYGDIDLICDPRDNIVKVMEINPRLTAPIKICFEAGINIADMLINFALGNEIAYINNYKEGIYLRHEGLDLVWFLLSKNRFSVKPNWFWMFGDNLKYQIMDLDDPLPIYGYILSNVRDVFIPSARRYKFQKQYLGKNKIDHLLRKYPINTCVNDITEWNEYIYNHEGSTIYHDIRWEKVIKETFGHESIFLSYKEDGRIKGVLPLFLMNSMVFGNYLVSLPFVDNSGVLADDNRAAHHLVDLAIEIARVKKVDFLELRNTYKIEHSQLSTRTHKVHFDLSLTSDPQTIWKKIIHENIRNKIRKALKNQLRIEMGNSPQFIYAFYNVFSMNMRDLGTPVYPLKFFLNMAKEFPEEMKVFLVYYKDSVIGGKIVFFFKDVVYFIYHSSYRKYAHLAPNNLLYWAAIEYACKNNYKVCNMGRSTINSGPFNFKKKWGGEMKPFYWQYYLCKASHIPELNPENPKYLWAINCWKHMPLPLTRLIGPLIAKHIP